MARTIVVEWDGIESSFSLAKLDRGKLYGSKKRIPVDREGNTCSVASIDVGTGILLRSGMTAQGYFSPSGEWLPNAELTGINADGSDAALAPSTLGVAQKGRQASPESLLDLRVDSVYALDPEELDEMLATQLEKGLVLTIPFNYRADYQSEHGYLLRNKEGFFLLVGQPVRTDWITHESRPVADEEIETEDDLDFDMF